MEKQIKIALAGNPNCGKTTLFNALTGSNQFVGNWPGVTVEKKEGRLKKHDDVVIMDLPGIYSLSPYTLEEVVARNYLIDERPDAILNIVDGTNLERNLYLTTQLTEVDLAGGIIGELCRFAPSELLFNSEILKHKEITAYVKDHMSCSVELLDEDKAVSGVEYWSFPYELVDERWVFTQFQLVY